MRFGVVGNPQRPWADTLAIVTACDAAGWDSVWFPDHFMPDSADGRPAEGTVIESLAVMAGLASATSRVRLGPLVCGNLYRHPAVLANAAATINRISNGRFVLGVGAGWQVNEHAAYGIDLLGVGERLDRFAEACAVLRSLLAAPGGRASFEGQSYTIADAPTLGSVPLLVGGGGERRTMRVAAEFADEWNAWCTPAQLTRKRDVLAAHCDAVGRDLAAIACSTPAMLYMSTDEAWLKPFREQSGSRPVLVGTPGEIVEQVAAYRDAGLAELMITDWNFRSVERATDTLGMFLQEVAVHFR